MKKAGCPGDTGYSCGKASLSQGQYERDYMGIVKNQPWHNLLWTGMTTER